MRFGQLLSRIAATSLLSAIAIHLSGCDKAGSGGATAPPPSPAANARDAEAPYVRRSKIAEPAPPPASLATGPSTSRDPAVVLVAWAKSVSLKDWAGAYAYWGHNGTDSGLTLDEFKASWGRLEQPDLEIRKGHQEGAAGSLFYSAPVTIVDGKRRIKGEVVLRRVNDVAGATAEDLRWHIEQTTLEP